MTLSLVKYHALKVSEDQNLMNYDDIRAISASCGKITLPNTFDERFIEGACVEDVEIISGDEKVARFSVDDKEELSLAS